MRIAITIGNLKKLRAYQEAAEQQGLECVINPDSLNGLDGLMLAGGADISPSLYGEPPHPQTEAPDNPRDAREWALLTSALERDTPVLGICRGNQFFNVFFGGKLVQHLETTHLHRNRHSEHAHDVAVLPGTLLESIVGPELLPVNSRHHQGVELPAKGLRVAAVSPSDNLVEALEIPGKRFALAVQWHPEDRTHVERERKIFEAFAHAVRWPHRAKP